MAAAFILYGLVFGLDAAKRVAPPIVIEKLIAAGLLLYAGTGFLTLILGGQFLDYQMLEHGFGKQFDLPSGQHLGIFLVEFGVGITVTAVMTMIFYVFAGRKQIA